VYVHFEDDVQVEHGSEEEELFFLLLVFLISGTRFVLLAGISELLNVLSLFSHIMEFYVFARGGVCARPAVKLNILSQVKLVAQRCLISLQGRR